MAGPSKQFDQDIALDQALQVFWDKGYEATSMQDLLDVMGINRASLYQTYGNKQALFQASFRRYIERSLGMFGQAIEQGGPPLDNLQRLFEQIVDSSLQGSLHGCFINNTAVELGPHSEEYAALVREAWQGFESIFTTILERARTRDELSSPAPAAVLANLLNTQLQGLMVQTKVATDRDKLLASVASLFNSLRTARK